MVASTDIKFYVHTNNNAPQLQNAYGSMINVLDACLVNGINIGTISSLTASGSTVTALFSSAHNLMQYQVIKITGANQREFNGEHRILTVQNAQSVTFELAVAPSTTTATGTITASLPSLGWEKPFSSSNPTGGGKAAYRSKNTLLLSRPFLRVVDELDLVWNAAYAKYAKVGLVEDMTSIDTLIGVQAPFDTSSPSKNWSGTGAGTGAYNGWAKWYYAYADGTGGNGFSESNNADHSVPAAGNREYYIIGNSDTFIVAVKPSIAAATRFVVYAAGTFESVFDVDVNATFLASTLQYTNANSTGTANVRAARQGLTDNQNSNLICLLGPITGEKYNTYATATTNLLSTTGNANIIESFVTLGFSQHSDVFLKDERCIRGKIPFINWVYQATPYENKSFVYDKGKIYLALNLETRLRETGQVLVQVG